MDYNARFYSSRLGRFASADTMIPGAGNPIAWDRYAGMGNNPIVHNDPTGHMQEESDSGGCDSRCQNTTRQTHLLSLVLPGSGTNGAWTAEDYQYYYANRDGIWGATTPWVNTEPHDWNTFSVHVQRLASNYSSNERETFTRDFGLLFAGIPYDVPWGQAALQVSGGPTLGFLNEGTEGMPDQYLETVNSGVRPEANQSHHYAGLFFLGFFTDVPTGVSVNVARDVIDPGPPIRIAYNPGDIALGNVAVQHGNWLRHAYNQNSPTGNPIMDLAGMIAGLAH